MSVTLDVSKLSGWLNDPAYCRVETRAYGVWGEVRDGRREGVRRERKHSVQGEGLTGYGAESTRGAHLKHAIHVGDFGRVEAQRLVERPCVLPSRNEGIRSGV